MGVGVIQITPQMRILVAIEPVDGLPAVSPRFRFRHNRSMPERNAERKLFVSAISTYFSPHRRGFYFRIARRQ